MHLRDWWDRLVARLADDAGQTMAEYAMVTGAIVLTTFAVVMLMGIEIQGPFNRVIGQVTEP